MTTGISAVEVVRHQLANSADLVAVVDASRIMAGTLPINYRLPAIVLQEIYVVEDMSIRVAELLHTAAKARIQITAFAATFSDLYNIFSLVEAACHNVHGIVGDVEVDSIVPDLYGPEFTDNEATIHFATLDLIVRFTLPVPL